jgi:ABC-type nitrate/sulfonate/bicarbonate transport system permease component
VKFNHGLKLRLLSFLGIISFLLIWELATDIFRLLPRTSLPSPVVVFMTFISKWFDKIPDGATLDVHILSSFQVAITSFAISSIIGVPLGILMAWYKKIDRLVTPIFDFLRTIPPLAWIPIMILWLGIGVFAKAAVVFVAAFIPCVINSYSGIKQTNKVYIWGAQVFGASRERILLKVAIPSALPYIFTGLKISLNTAWTGLVAAELLGSSSGLGYMLNTARNFVRTDIVIVGMLMIGLTGLIMSASLDVMEKLIVKGAD